VFGAFHASAHVSSLLRDVGLLPWVAPARVPWTGRRGSIITLPELL
jgi:hypothetical protein